MSDGRKEYYALLDVNEDASTEAIKNAYKAKRFLYHPDKKDTGDIEKFKKLVAARDALFDPEIRKIYDKDGETGVKNHFKQKNYANREEAKEEENLLAARNKPLIENVNILRNVITESLKELKSNSLSKWSTDSKIDGIQKKINKLDELEREIPEYKKAPLIAELQKELQLQRYRMHISKSFGNSDINVSVDDENRLKITIKPGSKNDPDFVKSIDLLNKCNLKVDKQLTVDVLNKAFDTIKDQKAKDMAEYKENIIAALATVKIDIKADKLGNNLADINKSADKLLTKHIEDLQNTYNNILKLQINLENKLRGGNISEFVSDLKNVNMQLSAHKNIFIKTKNLIENNPTIKKLSGDSSSAFSELNEKTNACLEMAQRMCDYTDNQKFKNLQVCHEANTDIRNNLTKADYNTLNHYQTTIKNMQNEISKSAYDDYKKIVNNQKDIFNALKPEVDKAIDSLISKTLSDIKSNMTQINKNGAQFNENAFFGELQNIKIDTLSSKQKTSIQEVLRNVKFDTPSICEDLIKKKNSLMTELQWNMATSRNDMILQSNNRTGISPSQTRMFIHKNEHTALEKTLINTLTNNLDKKDDWKIMVDATGNKTVNHLVSHNHQKITLNHSERGTQLTARTDNMKTYEAMLISFAELNPGQRPKLNIKTSPNNTDLGDKLQDLFAKLQDKNIFKSDVKLKLIINGKNMENGNAPKNKPKI